METRFHGLWILEVYRTTTFFYDVRFFSIPLRLAQNISRSTTMHPFIDEEYYIESADKWCMLSQGPC